LAGSSGDEFLGHQGDEWDAQWDILWAVIGCLVSLLALSSIHHRQLAQLLPSESTGTTISE